MKLPALFAPTTTYIFRLSSSSVAVPMATPQLRVWPGSPPTDSYGGKQVLDFGGRLAFAELAILWAFQESGWDGVWIDTFRRVYRSDYWNCPAVKEIPSKQESLLRQIREQAGTHFGAWDVYLWCDSKVLFAESKRRCDGWKLH